MRTFCITMLLLLMHVLHLLVVLLADEQLPDQAAQPQPQPAVADTPGSCVEITTRVLQFQINPPKTALDELKTRVYIGHAYWALGQSVSKEKFSQNGYQLCCKAVGCLDSSIPVPRVPEDWDKPKQERIGNNFSKYGNLRKLLDAVNKETEFKDAKGKPIFTAKEQKRLLKLADRGRGTNGGAPVLYLTYAAGDELFGLLSRITYPPPAEDE